MGRNYCVATGNYMPNINLKRPEELCRAQLKEKWDPTRPGRRPKHLGVVLLDTLQIKA